MDDIKPTSPSPTPAPSGPTPPPTTPTPPTPMSAPTSSPPTAPNTTPPPAGNPPTSSPTKPAKKTNVTMIVIIIVAVLVVMSVGGYLVSRYLARKVSEKATESIMEAATGNKVDVNTSDNGVTYKTEGGELSVGTKAKWPTDVPSSLPEFTFGTISGSSKTGETGNYIWTMGYEKVSTDAYTKYKDLLTSKGWTITSETSYGNNQGLIAQIETYEVTFSVYGDNAEASIMLGNK